MKTAPAPQRPSASGPKVYLAIFLLCASVGVYFAVDSLRLMLTGNDGGVLDWLRLAASFEMLSVNLLATFNGTRIVDWEMRAEDVVLGLGKGVSACVLFVLARPTGTPHAWILVVAMYAGLTALHLRFIRSQVAYTTIRYRRHLMSAQRSVTTLGCGMLSFFALAIALHSHVVDTVAAVAAIGVASVALRRERAATGIEAPNYS
jgi:hypothetical protein